MRAFLKNYRQSPRKVRIVADLVRGKQVDKALLQLKSTPKRATRAIIKLIESARTNAVENDKAEADNLFIKSITVDEAPTLKRFRARARGRAARINKRASHVKVTLDIK